MIELQQNEMIQEEKANQTGFQDTENQGYTTIKTIFQELKDIQQFQVSKNQEFKNTLDQCLFYFNLTKDQSIYKESQLEINPNIIKRWNDGFLKKDNDQQIIAYFQNIIQANDQSEVINYGQLSKIKFFVKGFLEKNKFKRLSFVVQFNQEQQVENLKIKMKHRIHQLFEGFFEGFFEVPKEAEEEIMIFCVLCKQEKINSELEINKNDKFGLIYILNKQEFHNEEIPIDVSSITINYFNQISNNRITVMQREEYFTSIGYSCNQYIQNKVLILFEEYNETLSLLKFQLKTLLALPTNLNDKVNSDTKIKKFQDDLKQLIEKIKEKIPNSIENLQLYQLIWNILKTARESSQSIKEDLKNMEKSSTISCNINNLLNFHFDFQPEYNNILEHYKNEDYRYYLVKPTIQQFQNQIIFWLDHYDSYIPQRLSYISSFFCSSSNYQNTNDSPSVVVLGLTKLGKSTLINIVNNPDNIKLVKSESEDYCFDVIDVDKRIQISHENNSQTDQTIDLEIKTNTSDLIFIDTPGFTDTQENRRLMNQINIFFRLKKSKQFVILFMIDGKKLIQSKNDLQLQIKLTNSFFNQQLNTQYLEQILIPVFTKVSEDMMTNIKTTWETQTMNNCNNPQEKEFLRILKNKIDNNKFILIHKAESYFTSNLEQLEDEVKKQSNEIKELKNQKEQDNTSLTQKREEKEKNEDKIQCLKADEKQIEFNIKGSSIKDLRENIFNQCQLLLIDQQREQVQLDLILTLTPSMKQSLETILEQLSCLYIIIDDQISYVIIQNFLSKQRSLDEIEKLLQYIQNNLQKFKEKQINSEQLWLDICKILDIPKEKDYLDEQFSQLQKFHYVYSTCFPNQIEIQQQKFEKFNRQIDKLYASCTQEKDTIISGRNWNYGEWILNVLTFGNIQSQKLEMEVKQYNPEVFQSIQGRYNLRRTIPL